jgi:hypothetical protein
MTQTMVAESPALLCPPIGHDEASRSQNSREFLVYLWLENSLPCLEWIRVKAVQCCCLAPDRVETSFCIFAIFFNQGEFAELLAEVCDIIVKFSLNNLQLFFSMQTFSPRQHFCKI